MLCIQFYLICEKESDCCYVAMKESVSYRRKKLHPAGKMNQYTPPRVCVLPPSSA